MSEQFILVKYELEDGIPIDESSANLQSTFAPSEIIDWVAENNYVAVVKIKESAGDVADIPVNTINDNEDNCLENILRYVEGKLIILIEEAHSHISSGVLIKKETENDFSALHIWLNLHALFKEKEEKYRDSQNIKIVVG